MRHPTGIARAIVSVPGAFVVATLFVVALMGCDGSRNAGANDAPNDAPESEADAELMDLAAIGGAQDVWGFSFGFDASRELVREQLGEPNTVSEAPIQENGAGPQVVRWFYDGLEVTFLSNPAEELEFVLSVRVEQADVPLRGGLRIGMPVDEALALLGEPRVSQDNARVWFYLNTTIELTVRDGRVEAVTLARAMP